MYRYRRREWDESRGVAYLPAQVLTDPEFTATDVAVLVARAGWSDYQGRINPGGSLRAVARRARVSHPSVLATYRKLRERGLLVGDRLRVEQLLPHSPHARAHCRQDLQAATNRSVTAPPSPLSAGRSGRGRTVPASFGVFLGPVDYGRIAEGRVSAPERSLPSARRRW